MKMNIEIETIWIKEIDELYCKYGELVFFITRIELITEYNFNDFKHDFLNFFTKFDSLQYPVL